MVQNVIDIKNLSKSYYNDAGFKQIVLEHLNLKIVANQNKGSIFSILAPFGSGKSTLLKIIAGLEKFEGQATLNGKSISIPNGEIIYIPEKIFSYPWLDVKANVELPAKLLKYERQKSKFSTSELIKLTGLAGYENYYTSTQESGFRLRIAIARALSFDPKFILLDDVLKNLSGETCAELIVLLQTLKSQTNTVFIFATTNISNSILLSEKIYLMKNNPGSIFKEIDIPEHFQTRNSEIITKYRNEIENHFKSQGVFHSVLVSL